MARFELDVENTAYSGDRADLFTQRVKRDGQICSGTVYLYFNHRMHDNFLGKKHKHELSNFMLAKLLVEGSKQGTIPGRGLFEPYIRECSPSIENIMRYHLDMRHHESMEQRLYDAGHEIKWNLIDWVEHGNVRPGNGPVYARQKYAKVGSMPPFIASGDLLTSMEVDVDVDRS